MQIRIIYEDEFILALDKPSGLMMHADGRTEEETLADWVSKNYPDLKDVGEEQTLQNGEKIKRPGIVHRLDKDTSGVVVIAKTKESYQFLKEQFQDRKTEKVYKAFVYDVFSEEKMEGVIDKPIGRSSSDFRRWSAEFGAKGELREAVTEYKVLAQGPHPSLRVDPLLVKKRVGKEKNTTQTFAFLEVRPKTGRTHQIRVHLKAISHPVVCDRLYAPNLFKSKAIDNKLQSSGRAPNKECSPEKCLGLSRLALHAFSIKFQLPNEVFINVESPLPKEFENAKNLLLDQGLV